MTTNRAQRRKAARTKIPARKVQCDDLEITLDGKTYHPHAGETVSFRGGSFLNILGVAADLASLSEIDTESQDASQVTEMRDKLNHAADEVAPLIVAWTWTDDDGDAYLSPPSPDILRHLRFEELAYLATVSMGDMAQRSDDDRKNAS